jgi:hypothetical protein
MTFNSHSLCTCAGLFAVASLGAAGCLCPPCPGTAVAAGPTAAAVPVTEGANAASSGPVANGSRLAMWDGEEAGGGAQGWESCDQKPACKVKVASDSGTGIEKSNSIKFHGEGGGWIGMGWNLFGWYPENAGVDLSPYTHLTFQIRVESKSPDTAVEPSSVTLVLGCSKNKKDSAGIALEKYAKGFADGNWHKVSIPISALTKGAAQFDLQSVWEFRLSVWSTSPRYFDMYVDDLAAEKH